jgi:uncharacterized protein (DUF4415 family)
MSKKPLTDKNGEVRNLTREDVRQMRPARDVLGQEFLEDMATLRRQRGERGPQKAPLKQQIALRVDSDVLDAYKAAGPGWQTRMNLALRAAMGKG